MTTLTPKLYVVAVFVSHIYLESGRLRVWAKMQPPNDGLVLLTDDPFEGNTILMRDLRCAGVVSAIVRTPGTHRTLAGREDARMRRDDYMARLATKIVIFDSPQAWEGRWPEKEKIYFEDRQDRT